MRGRMESYPTTNSRAVNLPGSIAPADGNVAPLGHAGAARGVQRKTASASADDDADNFDWLDNDQEKATGHAKTSGQDSAAVDLATNNERLADAKPKLVNALRELVRQYREEGIAARRHEIRRIRQARLFWQGLQYAWWNPNDMNWHLPFEQKFSDDRALEEMPRYQFVTNFYQGFGLSVHRAKLKAAYPHAAEKIETSPSQGAEDVYARVSRLSVEQGLPSIHPGDALMNLITFDRTWLRPWAFYAIEDLEVRGELLALFPDGCYVAFAGDAYCEARNESMDDHWRVLHALPGDGQNRPSVGDSLVQVLTYPDRDR